MERGFGVNSVLQGTDSLETPTGVTIVGSYIRRLLKMKQRFIQPPLLEKNAAEVLVR